LATRGQTDIRGLATAGRGFGWIASACLGSSVDRRGRLRDLGFRWCAAQHRGQVQLSLWVGGSSVTPDPRRPSNHAARFDQRRPIRGRAALAFPADVRAAGTRNCSDDHVSRQQPVTTRTALGRSVHPLRAREVRRLANINTHTHHTSIRSITKSRAVRESLLFVVSQ
jgi:hypothetical protein